MKKQIREVLSKYRGNQGYTMEHAESELLNLFSVSGCFPNEKEVEEKHNLDGSWGNTSHPDECYKQGLKDMYEAIVKELNNR